MKKFLEIIAHQNFFDPGPIDSRLLPGLICDKESFGDLVFFVRDLIGKDTCLCAVQFARGKIVDITNLNTIGENYLKLSFFIRGLFLKGESLTKEKLAEVFEAVFLEWERMNRLLESEQ